jgi:ATP-dependent RNA helicase RhlE
MTTFHALGLSEPLVRGVLASGYTTPTPIQAAAIPVALEGRDLTGCAQTGTGKTAAFVLPLLDRLSDPSGRKKGRPVRALVVTPTRELALQVEESVRLYGRFTGLRSAAIYGGVSMHPQRQAFRRGVDVVIATPGRLLDHLNQGALDLSAVEVLVLDEADRMLDMGFVPDVRRIVAQIPARRQTLLFSATMPPAIEALAASLQDRPTRVAVGEQRSAAETVTQRACRVPQERKMDLLLHVLRSEPVEAVLVFSRTKHRADRITKKLGQHGIAAAAIHSNRTQGQRQRALAQFRDGAVQVLVATDIAARGIDVDGISHVINFDTPNQAEDYIHRIGRTGRAEATGEALTFVSSDEEAAFRAIEKHTGRRISQDALPDLATPPAPVALASAAPARAASRPSGGGTSGRAGATGSNGHRSRGSWGRKGGRRK